MKRKKVTIKKEAIDLCKKLTHYTYAEAMSEAKRRGLAWMQCDTCHLMRCNEVGSEQANEEVETAKHWILGKAGGAYRFVELPDGSFVQDVLPVNPPKERYEDEEDEDSEDGDEEEQ